MASGPLWPEIKRLAEIHRFSALLAYSASSLLPAAERAWRDKILMSAHRQHGQRLAALRRMTDAFRNEGLTCVSLKGPLLSERFHPHPFLRPSNDIDLFIREADAGTAAKLMQKMGFSLEGRHPWPLQRQLSQHLNFSATDWSPRVEVHYSLYLWNRAISEASGEFLERSVGWQSAAGFDASVLSRADDAFYSCIHAANHAFHRLRWLYDLLAIANSLTSDERARVRELAIRYGFTGHMMAASMAAEEFFGEKLKLDCSGFAAPWLLGRLTHRHTRRMVERVEGNTVTLAQKAGFRLDLCRMAGSPVKAMRLLANFAGNETRKQWHEFRHKTSDPGVLARTLPGALS
jgi:hypothetical protein